MSATTDDPEDDRTDIMTALSYPGYDLFLDWSEDAAAPDHARAVTARKIRSLYDDGHPFLTRAALQDLSRQLRSMAGGGGTVHVKGLDGTPVEFKIEIGRTFPIGHSDMEWIVVAPVVRYMPFETMVADEESYPYNSGLAYCNLQIAHQRKIRNRISGEFLTPLLPSYADLQSYFRSVRDSWRGTEACTRLMEIIAPLRLRCNKIVGFALGSMSWELRKGWAQRSAFQHAMFLSLRQALQACQLTEATARCFAQDPAYTDLDESLLLESGITTVNDPDGFLEVDRSSAVISCSPDVSVKEILSEIALPALIIWDTVNDSKPRTLTTDPDSPRVREMLESRYVRMDFPGDDIHFGDLSIYTRR